MMKQLSSREIDRMIERLRKGEGVLSSGEIGYLTAIVRRTLVSRQVPYGEWAEFDRTLREAEERQSAAGRQINEEQTKKKEEPDAQEESAALFVRESMRLQTGPDSRRQRGR